MSNLPKIKAVDLLGFTDAAFRDVMIDHDKFWKENFEISEMTPEVQELIDKRCKKLKVKRRI